MKEDEKPSKLSTFSDAWRSTALSKGSIANVYTRVEDIEDEKSETKEDPEYTLWRACRLYCKMNGITQAEACDILKDDPELIHEWATKND